MDADMVARVRRFNRMITQRVGALQDHYLARDRPLGEARLLWEIGGEGRDLRSLRRELDLDSGYLSRMLRSLESADLVNVDQSAPDRRARTARLTRTGRAERALLDRRSDELATSFLAPLGVEQRKRLVDAMGVVERLLTAALVEIRVVDPGSPPAKRCLAAYFAELAERFDAGFDPARSIPADAHELRRPAGLLLVAFLRTEAIGCAALKLHGRDPAEIKRMWVSPAARGLGVGRRLLTEVEQLGSAEGAGAVRLETNRALVEAIGLYRSSGYQEVAAFNEEPYADHWFEKRITARARPSAPDAAPASPPTRRTRRGEASR